MNWMFIIAMIPDELLKPVCAELRKAVDALETRDTDELQAGLRRIVEVLANELERRGLTPEKIMELVQTFAPGVDLPFDLEELFRISYNVGVKAKHDA